MGNICIINGNMSSTIVFSYTLDSTNHCGSLYNDGFGCMRDKEQGNMVYIGIFLPDNSLVDMDRKQEKEIMQGIEKKEKEVKNYGKNRLVVDDCGHGTCVSSCYNHLGDHSMGRNRGVQSRLELVL